MVDNQLTDQQKSDTLKSILLKNIYQQHQSLVNSIRELPIDGNLKHNIIYTIGSGYLWTKDAIECLDFTTKQPPVVDVPPPIQPDDKIVADEINATIG